MFKQHLAASVFAIALLSPAIGSAASFPCEQSHLCVTETAPQKPTATAAVADDQRMSINDLIDKLELTEEQSLVVYHTVQKQMPEVTQTMERLSNAETILRDMALNKKHDKQMAKMLVQIIADNSANLAVLQAARDYEVLSILTPAQVQRYYALNSKGAQ